MKLKSILTGLSFALCMLGFTQEGSNPWEENYSAVSHGQHPDAGSVSIDITNQGRDVNECITKAKQQALFVAIFKGYAETSAGPASAPLTEKKVYNQNIDFFKTYLSSNMEGLNFVTSAKTNIKKPGSKISKKVIETTTTVEITKNALKKDLESQGIIKGVADLGFKPEILIVPGNVYMETLGFVTKVENQGVTQSNYNYTEAVNDPQFNSLALFVKAKFDDAFDIASFQSKLDAVTSENLKNSLRDEELQESSMDILTRVVAAELWIKLDLKKVMISGGQETQYTITMTALDPLTQNEVINGLPQTISTYGDNEQQLLKNTINAVSDEFRPRVLQYFTEREVKGMKGKIEFRISEELEVNFYSDIEIEGEDVEFSELIGEFVEEYSISNKPSGAQTKTKSVYEVWIPTKTKTRKGGIVTNDFKKFGKKIKKEFKKLGYDSEIEQVGLGKAIVTFKEEI
jgi:hypothetical protein